MARARRHSEAALAATLMAAVVAFIVMTAAHAVEAHQTVSRAALVAEAMQRTAAPDASVIAALAAADAAETESTDDPSVKQNVLENQGQSNVRQIDDDHNGGTSVVLSNNNLVHLFSAEGPASRKLKLEFAAKAKEERKEKRFFESRQKDRMQRDIEDRREEMGKREKRMREQLKQQQEALKTQTKAVEQKLAAPAAKPKL